MSFTTKSFALIATLIALAISSMTNAHAAIVLDVVPSSAPNSFGSPSWSAYMNNAMNALQNGLTSVGDRDTDPTAYVSFADGSSISVKNAMVTSFNSWLGEANPAAPFDNENGNRLHFGLHAFGDTQFTLADVQLELESSDGNVLGFSGTLATTTFNGTSRIGIDWGMDGIGGTADDIVYNSGEGDNVPVNELFYVGAGNGYWPADEDAIADTYAWANANSPLDFSGTYSILGYVGSASVTLVPEPSTIALAGLAGLAGVAIVRRRRRA